MASVRSVADKAHKDTDELIRCCSLTLECDEHPNIGKASSRHETSRHLALCPTHLALSLQ
jgi:hypothetical protein